MEKLEELIFMAEKIKSVLFQAGQEMESGPGRVLVLRTYNHAASMLGLLAGIQRDVPESWSKAVEDEQLDPGRAI